LSHPSTDKQRVTVTLAVTKSGKMLPPTIIEKSQSKAAKERPHETLRDVDGIMVWKQHTNTMTSDMSLTNILSASVPTLTAAECGTETSML